MSMSKPPPITEAPRTVGPPETGVLGVGAGVLVGPMVMTGCPAMGVAVGYT